MTQIAQKYLIFGEKKRTKKKHHFLFIHSFVPSVESGKAERSEQRKERKETYFFTTIQPSLS
jgi:hypothetical protein